MFYFGMFVTLELHDLENHVYSILLVFAKTVILMKEIYIRRGITFCR